MTSTGRPVVFQFPARNGSVALYRLYDAEGQLLHLGVSYDPDLRWRQHVGRHWWSEVARASVEWFPNRQEAMQAELKAIHEEQPRYNINGKLRVTKTLTSPPRRPCGERLRTLRLLMGMSQADLSATAGVTQALISYAEKGTKSVSDDLLAAVAAVTGTPASFFDVDPDELPTDTLHFRKKATASAKEVKRVEATVREAYRVAARLLEATRVRRGILPCAEGDIDGEDIETLALNTRDALSVGRDGPMRHVTRACERAGIPIVPLVLVDAHGQGEDVLVGHSGVSCWRGPGDPYLISYFTASSGDRQRFTIAHELGHLVLHMTRRTISAAQAEAEAHRFAGALLLPEERAREAFEGTFTLRDLAQLKQRWGISIQALVERAHRLGVIDDERRSSLYKQISARGWRTIEPVTVHPEQPALMRAMLGRRFGEPLSVRQAAEDLGLHPVLMRSLAPDVPSETALLPERDNVVSLARHRSAARG